MRQQLTSLIGYASGHGAQNRGTQQGPLFCKQHRLEQALEQQKVKVCWDGCASSSLEDPEMHILESVTQLATHVENTIEKGNFPITIGGDHSMAIGTWYGVVSALHAQKEFGLLWVDAHMDAHTPCTSDTGNIHGMPLAYLLGAGTGKIAEKLVTGQQLSIPHTVLFGIRSFEPKEYQFLKELGIRIYFMEEIRQRGIIACWQEAIEQVSKAPKGWGITLDVDAIDPRDAPGTGCHEVGGIAGKDMVKLIKDIPDTVQLKAFEIAEFNPSLDHDNKTYKLIESLIAQFVQSRFRAKGEIIS